MYVEMRVCDGDGLSVVPGAVTARPATNTVVTGPARAPSGSTTCTVSGRSRRCFSVNTTRGATCRTAASARTSTTSASPATPVSAGQPRFEKLQGFPDRDLRSP